MPTQHSATLLGTTWVCLATLLWHVTTCWLEVDHFQTWANNTQHVTRHRTQHVVFSMYLRKNIHDWYWGFLVTHNYVYVWVCLCDLMYIICLCYFPLSLKLYFWIQYYLSQFFLFWSSLAHSGSYHTLHKIYIRCKLMRRRSVLFIIILIIKIME